MVHIPTPAGRGTEPTQIMLPTGKEGCETAISAACFSTTLSPNQRRFRLDVMNSKSLPGLRYKDRGGTSDPRFWGACGRILTLISGAL